MHFIIFEGTTEEERQVEISLSLCGDQDLKALSEGDVLWVITRAGGARPVPALCGRLVAERVEVHTSAGLGFDATHADSRYRLRVQQERSERCVPFPCDMIVSWEIWRQPFRGVRMLTDEQGQALEMEWLRSPRKQR